VGDVPAGRETGADMGTHSTPRPRRNAGPQPRLRSPGDTATMPQEPLASEPHDPVSDRVADLATLDPEPPDTGELAVPMLSEIIDGPVAPTDRVHAFDVLRGVCRRAPRPVASAKARLTSIPEGGLTPLAIAEAILVLDGGLIVCAGSEATTMREAVDDLALRLRRRLGSS
jgi:hypothetical protein